MKACIGILGGMGPLATCDLMQKVIRLTGAARDQDNFRLVVDCNTEIPDRTEAILHGGPSPLPQMVRSGVRLQSMGADVILLPCNTAHFFYDELTPYLDVPLLHMIRETAGALGRRRIRRAGLLATSGTVQTGLYQRELAAAGVELLCPDGTGQAAVTGLIYRGVKASDAAFDTTAFRAAAQTLLDRGAETLILGCTELPVAMELYALSLPTVDPTAVLAQAAVDFARRLEAQT